MAGSRRRIVAVAMGGQALPTVSVPPRSVPPTGARLLRARWRRFSAYSAVEVDRLHEERREAAGLDQVR